MSDNNACSYYDGTKLLSLMDINGEKPEIYICTSNRSAGKTTYFSRYLINRFLKYNEKFMILYRYCYELADGCDKFFKDIHTLFFPDKIMKSVTRSSGVYHELYLDDAPCGYVTAINNADQIKKMSHLMSDTSRIFFDEFQSETNKYCPNEMSKFISIHTSLARGQGKQVKYLPVIMVSNPISLINPYYVELGISSKLTSKTKFLRGDGFVLEQGFNESAQKQQSTSAFNRAFSSNNYVAYAAQGIYLNDNKTFIEKPEGNSRYILTFRYLGKDYAVREFDELGIMYCDDRPDKTFKAKIAITTEDHQINYVMLKANDIIFSNLRYFFEKGCFRFKNLQCKEACLAALSYK